MIGAEVGMAGGAGSAALAAIGERKRTQGHTVLWTESGHKSLLRLSFGIADGEGDRQECLSYKTETPRLGRGAVLYTVVVP